MSILQLEDLERNDELDRRALTEVQGGFYGFLSGLFAGSPGGALPSMTNNFFVDYDVTNIVMQQNPVNLNIATAENSAVSIGSFNPTTLNINSGQNLLMGGGASA